MKDGTPFQKMARDAIDDPSFKRKLQPSGESSEPAAKAPRCAAKLKDTANVACELASLPAQCTTSSSVVFTTVLPAPPQVPDSLLAKRRRLASAATEKKAAEQQQLSNRVPEIGATLVRRQLPAGESRLAALQCRVLSRLN